MNLRRIAVMAVIVATSVAGVVVTRHPTPATSAVFTQLAAPKTPYVPLGDHIASTYFCPGVPAMGDGVTASVVIANPGDSPKQGELTVLSPTGAPIRTPVTIAARSNATFDIAEMVEVPYAGVLVELAGGGAMVEQRASTPAGTSIAACGNDASTAWYLADGSTLDGIDYDLLLSNPFQDIAVVDLTFVTTAGPRSPSEFQSKVIPAGSMISIDLDKAGALDEELLSISAVSRRGRFVAAKAQSFAGSGRTGYTIALGSPTAGDQWYFADGEKGDGISEKFVLFNPTDEAVDVDVLALPTVKPEGGFLASSTVTVDSLASVVVDPLVAFPALADGRYAAVVSTLSSESIVAERVLTRTAGDIRSTSTVLGSRFGSPRWWLPAGVTKATEGALVVFNVTSLEGTVTVSVVGPGGPVAIPELTDIAMAPGAVVALDVAAPEAIGQPVVVSSATLQLIVEQRYPRASGDGRGGSLAIPE